MSTFIKPDPEIIQHRLFPDDYFPNNPDIPVLIYKKVFNISDENDVEQVEKTFEKNNWSNSWRNGIYDYHHYHGNTHEVLGIYSGHCIVQLGGDHGVTVELRMGDVLIIPAGVAHKRIAGENFKCVGAYPGGKDYNMHYGEADEKDQALHEIASVSSPDKDPVFGADGPLIHYWTREEDYSATENR